MSTTARIAAFTSGLERAAVPVAVAEKAKVAILHNLGVAMAAGSMARTAVAYADAVAPYDGGTGARLLISGREVSPFTAAYVNGALIHARAQDDVYFPGLTHVGATILPALLAVGEREGSSGEELLVALVAGYETAGAVSQGFAQRTTPRGFRATGIFGGIGATAGVARLLGLDASATAHALGIAASMAAGTNQTWVAGTQEWQFEIGVAATNGIRAVLQAQAGGTGAPDALEGVAGFYRAFMGDIDGVAQVGADLGTRWRTEDVTFKPYPVCAILQSPVTELVASARAEGFTAADVERVRLVLTPSEAGYPGTDSVGPFSDVGATLMSAPYCLAVALLEGRVTAADLRRQDDPIVDALVRRVSVEADPTLTARSFRLHVALADGRTVERSFTATASTYNWDRDGVAGQLRSMLDEMPYDEAGLERLVATVLDLDKHGVRDVVAACVA